jgi:predicted ribosome-associated RNA-binding protein Tma20
VSENKGDIITLTDEQLEAIQNDGIAEIRMVDGDVIMVGHEKHREEIIRAVEDSNSELERVAIDERDTI